MALEPGLHGGFVITMRSSSPKHIKPCVLHHSPSGHRMPTLASLMAFPKSFSRFFVLLFLQWPSGACESQMDISKGCRWLLIPQTRYHAQKMGRRRAEKERGPYLGRCSSLDLAANFLLRASFPGCLLLHLRKASIAPY